MKGVPKKINQLLTDPSSFSQLFSKVTGMGPIEFRKQLQHLPARKKLKQ
jgi:AraC-like DNA-binding protein